MLSALQPSHPKPPHLLRILHTADWHLGKRLFDQTRYEEFGQFLEWLIECINQHQVDVLVVAGDVFDTMTPSNKAQELYYHFLARLNETSCCHAIIVAGNHDSPSFLDAPKTLFRHFNIYVVGAACEDLCDEQMVLTDKDGKPVLIVAAVPYLRERDVRNGEMGDSLEKKQKDTVAGIKKHYANLLNLCQLKQNQLLGIVNYPIPILATGHLFAAGSQISAPNDGMRELYVGTLGQVGADIFDGFDYVALGHIHREQMVAKQSHIRYSGSPMAFCFDEIHQDKKILLIDFDKTTTTPVVTPIIVPKFRELKSFIGDFASIERQLMTCINELKNQVDTIKSTIWINIECHNKSPIFDLETKIENIIGDMPIKAINIKQINPNSSKKSGNHFLHKSLKELTPKEVFVNLLNETKLPTNKKSENVSLSDDEKSQLMRIYDEIIYEITHDDSNKF